MANEREKAQAIVAVVLAVAQALIVFGVAAGHKLFEIIDANQAIILGLLAAIIGLAQSFLPSVRKGRKDGNATNGDQ